MPSTQYQYGKSDKCLRTLSEKLRCRFLFCNGPHLKKISEIISNTKPQIGISVNWPKLIPESIIKSIPCGLLNAHPGDLPRYRGNSARNWAIINQEKHCALTIHFMAKELDAGPIVVKKDMKLIIKLILMIYMSFAN